MTEQGAKPRKVVIAGIALALAAAVVVASYVMRIDSIEKEAQADNAMLLMEEGIAQFQQRQYQQSLETLGRISEDEFQNWHINYFMGSSQIMLRDYETAVTQLEKALALIGEEPKVLYALGVAYYKLGNLSLSKAYFGRVLEIDPDNADARGLMDIVANMERKQLAEPESEDKTPPSQDEAGPSH